MNSLIEIAQCAGPAETGFLRVGLFLTIAALALIIRQPRKSVTKKEIK
jgi:hypothetical protein